MMRVGTRRGAALLLTAAGVAAACLAVWPVASHPAAPSPRAAEPSDVARGPGSSPDRAAPVAPAAAGELPADPRAAAVLAEGRAEADKLTALLAAKWAPAPLPPPPAPRLPAPRAPKLGKVDLAAVERKFRALPSDPEWTRRSVPTVVAQRARLARAGIDLSSAECRRDACRFELMLSGSRAETRRRRLSGQSRTLGSGTSVVHTSFEPSGKVRNVIYLTRDGRPFLG